MRRIPPDFAEGLLTIVLVAVAFGSGVATATLAEPAPAASWAATAEAPLPHKAAAEPSVEAGAPDRLCASARSVSFESRGSSAIPTGQQGEERTPDTEKLAVWDGSYEPPNARIALVHTASAARGRPIALLYIEQDWAELIETDAG